MVQTAIRVSRQKQGTTARTEHDPHIHALTHDKVDDDALLGQFIPLHYHGQMLAHQHRMLAFKEAITRRVPLGGRVLELGGGTGVMSYFAAQRASKVTCVERIPHVANAARQFLSANGVADRVEVVEANAFDFLPNEPVDAVICEMLHVGLLREKQAPVIDAFKRRYLDRFGGPLPIFIPEASFLAVQPVQHSFEFCGYRAPVPMFYEPTFAGEPTIGLTEPQVYAAFEYQGDIPQSFEFERILHMERAGTIDALRFITKNLVGIFEDEAASADWYMQHLVMPLPTPIPVEAKQIVRIRFRYDAGDSLTFLSDSIDVRLWQG